MTKLVKMLLCALLLCTQLMAQNRTVKGKVSDDKGAPVANASVVVKGTTTGTNTAADGSFSLSVPAAAKALVVSSLNFTDREITIPASNNVSVTLTSTANDLAEVLVQVPYGTVKKSSFTGSEGTVTAAAIEKQQNTSVVRSLEGAVAGVSSTSGGGAPGTTPDIRIRGFGSINATSVPLYVLNGSPYDGSIGAISSDDVESITVLKDASATNLYGSRAANGVIMITTKKGKRGRANVTASMRQGFSDRMMPEYDRLNSQQYYEMFWEAFRNSYYYASGQTAAQAGVSASGILTTGTGLVYNAYNVPGTSLVDPTTGKLNPSAQLLWNEPWDQALFRSAQRTNPTINISGADEKTDYFVSGGYLNEQGTAKFSNYRRYTLRATVNTQATSWLKTGLNMDGATDQRDGLFAGGTATSNPFYYSRQMGPIYPVYQHNLTTGAIVNDASGQPVFDFGTPAQMGARPYAANSNLLGTLALDVNQQKRISANFNTYAEIKFAKDFMFKTTLSANYFEVKAIGYQNNQYGDAAGVKGRSTVSFNRQISLTGNEVLSWKHDYGKHALNALVGHENYRFTTSGLSATKTGFSYPGQTALNNAAVVEAPPSSSEDEQTIESYFSKLDYTFDNKYTLSGSLRRDGSSRFAPATRWGNFYSVGAGWVATNEKFLENVKWLNYLKVRGSYGEAGNDNIGQFYQYTNYYFADGLGNYAPPTRIANPDLKWEANTNLSVGVEFTMFNKRLTGTVDLYDRRSRDLLFAVPIGPTNGTLNSSIFQNIGQSKNTGIELSLGYNVIRQRDFNWQIDFNVSTFKNRITQLPPAQKVTGIVTGNKKYTEGSSIYDFWLREFAGVDPTTGLSTYYVDVLGADGKPTGQRNLTTDGAKASFYYVGASSIPKYLGGITNSFRFKEFDLQILMTYSYGGKFYDGNYQSIMHIGNPGTAWSTDILNRWQKPGDITNVPRVQTASGQDYASSRFLFDASYLSIKNINLGYKLPASVARRLYLSDARLFASVDNAYMFTSKKGNDPQQNFDGTTGATYPLYRTVTVGLTVKL